MASLSSVISVSDNKKLVLKNVNTLRRWSTSTAKEIFFLLCPLSTQSPGKKEMLLCPSHVLVANLFHSNVFIMLFTFMYTGVLSACMSVYPVYSWLFHSPQEGVESPGTRITKTWAAICVPGMKTRSCGRASSAPLSHRSSPYSNLCEEKTFKGIWEIALPYVYLRRSCLSPTSTTLEISLLWYQHFNTALFQSGTQFFFVSDNFLFWKIVNPVIDSKCSLFPRCDGAYF